MRESVIYQDILQQGIQRGIEQGKVPYLYSFSIKLPSALSIFFTKRGYKIRK
jgi:hypothetical protein